MSSTQSVTQWPRIGSGATNLQLQYALQCLQNRTQPMEGWRVFKLWPLCWMTNCGCWEAHQLATAPTCGSSWFRGQKSRRQLARRAPEPQLNTFPRRKPVHLFFTLIHSNQDTPSLPLRSHFKNLKGKTPIFSVRFSLVVWRLLWIHWE